MTTSFDLSAIERQAEKQAVRARTASTMKARLSSYLQRRMPPEAKRDIVSQFNVRSSRVASDLSARSVSDGVELTGRARGINLAEFSARETNGGVIAPVETAKKARFVPNAFMARGINGRVLVFLRKIIGGKRVPRLPLRGVFGPSVADMLINGDREKRLGEYAQLGVVAEATRLLELESK